MNRGRKVPINGWTKRPERGPATKTIDMDDFERPRERRYGDAEKKQMSARGALSDTQGMVIGAMHIASERV